MRTRTGLGLFMILLVAAPAGLSAGADDARLKEHEQTLLTGAEWRASVPALARSEAGLAVLEKVIPRAKAEKNQRKWVECVAAHLTADPELKRTPLIDEYAALLERFKLTTSGTFEDWIVAVGDLGPVAKAALPVLERIRDETSREPIRAAAARAARQVRGEK